jgi:hypothetical protein
MLRSAWGELLVKIIEKTIVGVERANPERTDITGSCNGCSQW